jgi:hypothetical protein
MMGMCFLRICLSLDTDYLNREGCLLNNRGKSWKLYEYFGTALNSQTTV